MSEHLGRGDFVDAGNDEPHGLTNLTFTPCASTLHPTGFTIICDAEQEKLCTQEYLDLIWRKVQSVPPHEKTNLFAGCSSMATLLKQLFETTRDGGLLDLAITWATEAEKFGRDVKAKWKRLWPGLLAELLLQRFEHSQMQSDLEESCRQFRAYLHIYNHKPLLRGGYTDLVREKLRKSLQQRTVAKLLDESLVFPQIAEDALYRSRVELAFRLQWHGMLLDLKSKHHHKPDTLKMALSKLEQAISMGLPEADQATVKSLTATLRLKLKEASSVFELGFVDDFMNGNSIFCQINKISVFLEAWEVAVEYGYDTSESFLANAEESTKEILDSEDDTQYRGFEPEILVLAGKVSETCRNVFDGKRDPKLEDPVYYWTRCWNLKHGHVRFRLQSIHLLARRLFRQGKYKAAWARFQLARALIPIICPQKFQLEDKVSLVESLEEISINACATALVLGEVNAALEVLEEGRGLLLGHFDKSLRDLDRLEHQQIALFHKF